MSKFITVEGLPASGKSIATKFISDYLNDKNIRHIKTKCYLNTEEHAFLNELLHNKLIPDMASLAISGKMISDVITSDIIPAIMSETTIVSDEWIESIYAKFIYLLDLDNNTIKILMDMFLKELLSNITDDLKTKIFDYLTIYINVDMSVLSKRITDNIGSSNENLYLVDKKDYYNKLKMGYDSVIINRNIIGKQNNIFTIECCNDINEFNENIIMIMDKIYGVQS